MSLSIQVEGFGDIQRMVDPIRFEKAVDRAMERSGQIIRDETKKMPPVSGPKTGYSAKGIPVDSGQLRNTIHSQKLSQLAVGIIAPKKYASYVHEGTSRVPPRPFFRWVIEDFGGRDKIMDEFMRQFKKLNGK